MKQYGWGRFKKERENARKNVLSVPFTSFIKNTRVLRVRMVALEKKAFLFLQTSRATQHVELLVHNQHSKAALRIKAVKRERLELQASSQHSFDEAAYLNHRLLHREDNM